MLDVALDLGAAAARPAGHKERRQVVVARLLLVAARGRAAEARVLGGFFDRQAVALAGKVLQEGTKGERRRDDGQRQRRGVPARKRSDGEAVRTLISRVVGGTPG